ncbi:MAG: hypothetical protein ACREDR_48835, partial [Blastocatellia bacterium]
SMDLEATEMAVREAMHSAGAAILTVLLEEEPPEAKTIDCPCGRTAEYLELRPKSVLTSFQPIKQSRFQKLRKFPVNSPGVFCGHSRSARLLQRSWDTSPRQPFRAKCLVLGRYTG